uniref:Uncharacterized protein n=1 Tax=Seriola lalandi dorsalis TaxID=1841481 RepID=A0A3B4XML4_SERLL
ILLVLESYLSAVNDVAEFNSCSVFASEVKPSSESSGSSARWKEALLCQYTMDRLFSFSILTARVFAVGDPAHHAEGSAQICKQKH